MMLRPLLRPLCWVRGHVWHKPSRGSLFIVCRRCRRSLDMRRDRDMARISEADMDVLARQFDEDLAAPDNPTNAVEMDAAMVPFSCIGWPTNPGRQPSTMCYHAAHGKKSCLAAGKCLYKESWFFRRWKLKDRPSPFQQKCKTLSLHKQACHSTGPNSLLNRCCLSG